MIFLYLILLISFAELGLLQRTPTISYISENQVKEIGGTVDLDCSVQYSQDYPVLWLKIEENKSDFSNIPLSTNTALIIRNSRYSLRYDSSSTTYTLQIKDIQEADAGRYECHILISTSTRISAVVELKVQKPPIISDNSTRSIIATEGRSIQLECYASGSPTPRISWRRENNALLPTGGTVYRGSTIKIASVTKEDRGTYYCIAENGVGRGAKRSVIVAVEFSPVITVPHPQVGQAEDYDATLSCHIEAYPNPNIIWYKGNDRIVNNKHYSISNFATADEYIDTTLRIRDIESNQYGNYTCKANNKLGDAEAQVILYETSEPQCTPTCNPRKVKSYGRK